MADNVDTERHYKVVRYYTDFSAGVMHEDIASELTLEEAERVAAEHQGEAPEEEIVIQDQDRVGIDSERVIDEEDEDLSDETGL